MKKYMTVLMLMTAFITCKKTETMEPVKEPVGEETIIGKWELRRAFCGWSPGPVTYPAGNGTTITFNSNGQYTATGIRVAGGLYRLSTRMNGQGQIENLLYLGGNWNQEFRFSLTGNTFMLDENAFTYDGCEYRYQKIE